MQRRIMQTSISAGDTLQDWLIVIEHKGQTVGRVAHSDKQEDEVQE